MHIKLLDNFTIELKNYFMNKLKYISSLVLTVATSGIFSLNVNAQRGGNIGGGGGYWASGGRF
ncbi:MAG: hypothetical protein H7334_01110 [Ferruginibacter sp.]|nr:hypothetical protein [Ferruginibacter sp.]